MTIQMPTYSEKVLNQFAQKEWGKVQAFLKKQYSLPDDDCNDIFQESFIILLKNAKEGKLKDMTSSLSTYFLGICRNKAREVLRSKKHSVNIDDDYTFDAMSDVKDEKINNLLTLDSAKSLIEQKEALARQIVHDLPKPCNELLWGFFRDNYSLQTLATMLSKTVGYVKVTKHRCQEKFRKRYGDLVKALL